MSQPMRILVAEDSKLTQKIIRKALEGAGYQVLMADNGLAAFEIWQDNEIDLLLSDWEMPEMDGIDLVKTIRASQSQAQPYVFILTSRSDTENLVAGLEAGADDYLGKPFSPDELLARIKAGLRVLMLQRRLDADLRQVGKLQDDLLPKKNPDVPDLDICPFYVPSTQASGDYYDFFPASDHQIGLLIADVCDHGAPAAVFMAIIHAVAHSHPLADFDAPGLWLAQLNEHLVKYGEDGTFATAAYAVYDSQHQTVTFASAGHPLPLVYRAKTDTIEKPMVKVRPPLASLPFKPAETVSLKLEVGDRMLFYTDGITEVFDPSGAMFGEDRLAQALAQPAHNASDVVSYISATVNTFAQGAPLSDDQTMIVIVQS